MFARSSLIETARAWNSAASDPWNFSWQALTDSASMRACAGSYTPHGRSQCACTVRRGARMRCTMDESPPSASEEPVPEEPSEPESYRRGRKRVSGVVAGLALIVAAAAAFTRYRPARVAIEGISMAPTLLPDDWVVV